MAATITAPADLRACADCRQGKPLIEFGVRKNHQGRTYPYRSCLTCMARADRENPTRRARKTATQRAARAAKRDAITAEIAALIQATTVRCGASKAPLPTAEELAAWRRTGCPLRGAA
jgi:hypothetical protein